jgi:hypothetical protein
MKYLIAKLTINCSQLYHELWYAAISSYVIASPSESAETPTPCLAPLFECFMRGLWVEIIRSLRIVSSLEDDLEERDNPFSACMSMMNHTLNHSPTHATAQFMAETASPVSFQCICKECSRFKSYSLSIRDEGEILRTHFRALSPHESGAKRNGEEGRVILTDNC